MHSYNHRFPPIAHHETSTSNLPSPFSSPTAASSRGSFESNGPDSGRFATPGSREAQPFRADWSTLSNESMLVSPQEQRAPATGQAAPWAPPTELSGLGLSHVPGLEALAQQQHLAPPPPLRDLNLRFVTMSPLQPRQPPSPKHTPAVPLPIRWNPSAHGGGPVGHVWASRTPPEVSGWLRREADYGSELDAASSTDTPEVIVGWPSHARRPAEGGRAFAPPREHARQFIFPAPPRRWTRNENKAGSPTA